MIKFENTEVVGWKTAIRGMRNPKNSWDKSDSCHCDITLTKTGSGFGDRAGYDVGRRDLELMTRLRNAGTDHRKFMRMITVYVDITAPLYWWKEFDTYKVGTVANSCSTMHKIHDKEFTIDDFSCEHLLSSANDKKCVIEDRYASYYELDPTDVLEEIIEMLNKCRILFLETKDKKYWWQMIQLLPSSYNQRRTIMMNYEVLANIYKSRKGHKLDEWKIGFCDWIKTLPYSELITSEKEWV